MKRIGFALLLFIWIAGFVILGDVMQEIPGDRKYFESKESFQDFRVMQIEGQSRGDPSKGIWKQNRIKELTWHMLYSRFGTRPEKKGSLLQEKLWNVFLSKEIAKQYEQYYTVVLSDIRCFPVLEDKKKNVPVTYEDSWGFARNYGGSRRHEGTDLMAGNNKRDYFTIVSVSDGIVEKMGWLELGGYRIGVRSPSGAYFYYAHMSQYAETLQIGGEVKAGQKLGMMGDTGYSKTEGTTGKFDVHLHFGIYFDADGEEISVNPYYILRQIENQQENDSQKK